MFVLYIIIIISEDILFTHNKLRLLCLPKPVKKV